ncbi:MAG: class I tRNA ligase family protein [Saprospiraceae bacterium]
MTHGFLSLGYGPFPWLNGFKERRELDYYYPTSVLVTGWDIIFLWVARMIMAMNGNKQDHSTMSISQEW